MKFQFRDLTARHTAIYIYWHDAIHHAQSSVTAGTTYDVKSVHQKFKWSERASDMSYDHQNRSLCDAVINSKYKQREKSKPNVK